MNPKTLHKISYGLYVICSRNKEKINGQIANVLFQITSEPPFIAISINKQNLTHEYIEKSNVFTASILSVETSMSFIGNFGFKSGRDIDKFKNIKYNIGKNKTPIVLDSTVAYLEASVINKIDCQTHSIFIAEVNDAKILSDATPMTYEYYHKIKGGISPKTAPTYSAMVDKKQTKKEAEKMDKYVCTICGYVYDPEKGDTENGIEIGTKFADLPDDWVCPICGAGTDQFEKK